MNYDGPQLELLVRDPKQDNTAEVLDKLFSFVKVSNAKIGIFLKDKEDGELTAAALKAVEDRGF